MWSGRLLGTTRSSPLPLNAASTQRKGGYVFERRRPAAERSVYAHHTSTLLWVGRAQEECHGVCEGSFVPFQWQRELRDLVRLRVSLLEDQNRLQNGAGGRESLPTPWALVAGRFSRLSSPATKIRVG